MLQLTADTKVILNLEKDMGKEHFISKKVVFIKDSGKMIKCMVLENFIIQLESQLMKDNGKITNFQAKGKCITISQNNSNSLLILLILITLAKNGYHTKEFSFKTKGKGWAA